MEPTFPRAWNDAQEYVWNQQIEKSTVKVRAQLSA